MKIIDISKTISEDMIVYKNRDSKRIKRTIAMDYEKGHYYESRVDFDMHCGTHIDAPLHMIKGGNTIENIDLSKVIGHCKVFDLTNIEKYIVKDNIKDLDIKENDIIIFKTKNSYDIEYNPKFVYVEEDAAKYLVDIGIKCIGIDAMSLERDKPHHPSHKVILEKGIVIIEDLQLKDVEEGNYFLSCLPLKIKGSEASPVRAVLIKN